MSSLTLQLHRRAVFFFGLLLLLTLPAFWPTYFAPPKPVAETRVHLHGLLMFGWMALLIAQAGLIRAGHRGLHRGLGRVSYVLAPLVVVSTLGLLHLRLTQKIDAELLYFLWVILSLAALFAFSYVMAMVHRAEPAIHARYMVCTALALVDPVVGRIVLFHAGVEPPWMQVVTYALVDAILLWLAYADRRSRSGIRVFPFMLAVFVALQAPTFFVFREPWWAGFAQWLAKLPLP